jgi:Class III cytochrome C family/Outer membrane cytochrome MtrC/MtrF-like, domains II/IV
MLRLNKKVLMILTGLGFILISGGMAQLNRGSGHVPPRDSIHTPIIIAHTGSSPSLERPPVVFDHDLHTAALKVTGIKDCAACHELKETDPRLANPAVKVFKFPKSSYDDTDKTAIMYAYHNACVSCHRKMASEGKKAGPDIGMCGKCHVKRPNLKAVTWAWSPVFNYLRHADHVKAAKKWNLQDNLNVAGKVKVIGEVTTDNCQVCHHSYDPVTKKLIFKKDTENSCEACHKEKDDKNARAMSKVAHAACIGCHMKLAEKAKIEAAAQGRKELTEQEKKSFGPFECKGCHGVHKVLKPDEIKKIPRLVRGQKDIIDISLFKDPNKDAKLIEMKVVPFNHKVHEATAQFCSSCHHHSLENCADCHTREGDPKKGGGISFERAFHEIAAKQSCLGCHEVSKEAKQCAGCHQRPTVARASARDTCAVCHRGPSNGKWVDTPPLPVQFDKNKVPEKVVIKALAKEYKPAEMPHQKIITKLTAISNENSLARFFHAAKDQALCYGCHHKSQASAANKFPECGTCHTHPFDPKNPGRPGMMAAFHQQCTGCHKAMDQKPKALECDKCHAEKKAAKTVNVTIPLRGIPE